MRKYCTTIKNKAYIFLEVIIISFLFISLTLFVQILLNNSFKLYEGGLWNSGKFSKFRLF